MGESLNKLVEDRARITESRGIELSLKLDPNMPEVYENLEAIPESSLWRIICYLGLEVEDAKPSKALYQTGFDGDTQMISLSHNGKKLTDPELQLLNYILDRIARGEIKEFTRHGNRMAATYLAKYGGKIFLENIENGIYTIKTTVEIPLPSKI